MPKTRKLKRDKGDFDTTQLKSTSHGRTLHRDYTAHFFRWSFARRYITAKDKVLEIGCGEEKPLSKILTGGAAAHVSEYVGVDLNKLKPSKSQRLTFYGEFDFTSRYTELLDAHGHFDVVVHLEVIEHMAVKHGKNLLRAAYNCLRPGGTMLMSTPVYDGRRHAANHIHEYTVEELRTLVEAEGFTVERRFGTFMDIKHIGKGKPRGCSREAVAEVAEALREYYDNDALSNIFGPLYPDHARNNLWVCRKPISTRRKRRTKRRAAK